MFSAGFSGTSDGRRGTSDAFLTHGVRKVQPREFAKQFDRLAVVRTSRFDRVVVVADVLGGSVAADAGFELVAVALLGDALGQVPAAVAPAVAHVLRGRAGAEVGPAVVEREAFDVVYAQALRGLHDLAVHVDRLAVLATAGVGRSPVPSVHHRYWLSHS